MPEYDNTNRGVLFKNDRREKETHPNLKGSINIGGTEYWLSAWTKESKAGEKFISLSVGDEKGQQRGASKAAEATSFVDDPNDDIPF